jgi:SWI/SNF-related matrix-associated actin-dependent regulator 1 of chromatin subfamily A
MIITYNADRKRFESKPAWSERNTANPALKKAGFAFDWDLKLWHTAGYRGNNLPELQTQIAAKLANYFDEEARAHVGMDIIKAASAATTAHTNALEASHATEADIQIPVPSGLAYLPYQKAGIAYALRRQNTLIGDEMGLGKTIQAVGVANASPDAKSVLIVCPASLKLNWEREWKKWDVKGLSVGIAAGKIVPATDVVIVNYDILDKNADALRARVWDIMIADECHKAKNPLAKRTQFLLGKYTWIPEERHWNIDIQPIAARRRVFLTGTPIVNRPVELWPVIRALDPEGLGKFKSKFEKRYCGARHNGFGWEKSGATNLEELQERMRSSFLVRRLKSEVLKELPPKRRQVIVLEAPDARTADRLDELVKRENVAYDDFKSAGLKSEAIDFTAISAARKAIAEAIIPLAIKEIEESLEELDKIVVWGHHHLLIEALFKHFQDKAVVVYGETSMTDRQAAVDAFQTDSNVKLFIGSIQAAGAGLTLTAASNESFFEEDWVPGNIEQAEDRCHRIGQVNAVLVKHYVLDKSVSSRMVQALIDKTAVIRKGLDDQGQAKEQPQIGAVKPPKPTTKVNGVEVEIESLIDQQTAKAIHVAIRFLADRCDGALELDGAGFNKLDSRFGKDLANRFSLTPKQALAAQKLVRKYQGQIPEPMLAAAGVLTEAKHG